MTLTDLAKSNARTVVPFVVGLVVSLALRAGVDLHGYTPEVTLAAGWVYYNVVRIAEHYLSPRFGWLLGVAGAPQYSRPASKRKRRLTKAHVTVKRAKPSRRRKT